MLSTSVVLGFITILLAYFWQVFLYDFVFYGIGFGRTYNRIEDYPYTCRQLRHPLLESCEDLVLDSGGRALYAACSTSLGRGGWNLGGNHFNVSARTLTDHVSVLEVDEPGDDGFYGLRQLEITGDYKSSTGDKTIDVHGFKIEILSNGSLRFWMINHRPAVDEFGKQLDPKKVGANSTVEVFDLDRESSNLKHVKTLHSHAILTPNNIAATGNGGFLFTNDHHDVVAPTFLREFSFLFGPGSIGYCSPDGECKIAYPEGSFPNGIVKGHDGLYYVSQSRKARVTVFALQENGTLLKVDEILIGMPVDNLSIDAYGDIYGAAFPKLIPFLKAQADPVNVGCPSTVFRIRRSVNAEGKAVHEVTKVLEDIEAKVLPCSTAAVHDAKTGNFFLGSGSSPYITVCEKNI